MHDRAREYAICARALAADANLPGAAAIFDQALTNALAAIVARRWTGRERERGRIKSAHDLLDVVAAAADVYVAGIATLPDLDPPPAGFPLGDDPTPTVVNIALLQEGLDITQPPRHARLVEVTPLGPEHVTALLALNVDASLNVDLTDFDLEEYEEKTALADAREAVRARRYIGLLHDGDEWDRRELVDYVSEYTLVDEDGRIEPDECPACGLSALVPAGFDSYDGLIAWGTCVACSYTKSYDVADLEGRDAKIQRMVDDPDT